MTISVKPFSFYASSVEPLNDAEKAYFRAKMRRRVHGMILRRFGEMSENDIALRSLLAERLGVHRSQVTRWLASPSNLTLDTLSDLMLGMNREVDVNAIEVGDGHRSNYSHPTSSVGRHNTSDPVSAAAVNTVRISAPALPQATGTQETFPKLKIK